MKHDIVIVGLKVIADACGTSTKTVYRWISEMGFPASKVDGTWRAVPEDVKRWFSDQKYTPETPLETSPENLVK
jgi:predicted DNA-binding transcriptional regulator AlpA